jgi:hypothetical protein
MDAQLIAAISIILVAVLIIVSTIIFKIGWSCEMRKRIGVAHRKYPKLFVEEGKGEEWRGRNCQKR